MRRESISINEYSPLHANPISAAMLREDTLGGWVLAVWLVTVVGALTLPILPIDETRYVSVAWEMWQAHSQWVPLMNGQPYADKPPLLFWLIEIGWHLTGLSSWWPKLIAPLASLIAAIKLYRIARNTGASLQEARLAQLILFSLPLWTAFSQLVMFDVLLTACVVGAIEPLTRRGEMSWKGTFVSALWLGAALLTKGPVAFVVFLPVAMTAPLWRHPFDSRPSEPVSTQLPASLKQYYGRLVTCIFVAAMILACWALPATHYGGHVFAHSLLWGQTADRLSGPAAPHARPIWWYLAWLPVLLFPWCLWINQVYWLKLPLWRPRMLGQSLLFWWLALPFTIFSLISGKQLHYLVPLMPAVALLISRQLSHVISLEDKKTVAQEKASQQLGLKRFSCLFILLTLACLFFIRLKGPNTFLPSFEQWVSFAAAISLVAAAAYWHLTRVASVRLRAVLIALGIGIIETLLAHQFIHEYQSRYEIGPVSHALSQLEQKGKSITYIDGNYQATFQFSGRLEHPLVSDTVRNSLIRYAEEHPDFWLVGSLRDFPAGALHSQYANTFQFEGRTLLLIPARSLIKAGHSG
ncbi:Undecaprenyl phosphate-alpha-4-amino-4-deoxy-L-arabinose arabinosyl transferase [Halomonadaceae bacterium LMG 33818]|uniref:ArnT family glycosyltransferase n=1 Tax=Cernens ardua TaxID=3402176 RepID=UPI003EDC8FED